MTDPRQQLVHTEDGRGADFDAVVVGAGYSGLYMLHRLRELGLSARVYEAAGDVGGTWYWNRYPGARCDSESVFYSFSDRLSEELLQEWTWSERYAAQPEILQYLQWVADRMDLRRDIQFNTRVTQALYDEARNKWEISTDVGDRVAATYLITAVGCISTTNVPEFRDLENFQGDWYHTGAWPHEGVDFTGLRVGVIGTGATGVQVVPEVATQAAHLWVFQRTANYDIPAQNRPLDSEYVRQVKANYTDIWKRTRETGFGLPYEAPAESAVDFSPEERQRRYEAAWAKGGFYIGLDTFGDFILNQDSNYTISEFVRSKIRDIVHDPDTAEALAPKDHPFFTKRPPLEHGYYESFNRDNVTLVDVRRGPIEEITPRGLRTQEGEYELDAIVFATGFDAMTGTLFSMDIRGRGGLSLRGKWADGPRTYLGIASHGFPNMFMITGPQSPSVLSNMPVSIEQHADWISDCISHLRRHGLDYIEPHVQAEDGWVAHHNEVADATLLPQTASWWAGANIPGKKRILYPYPGGCANYRKICDDVAASGYEGFALDSHRVAAR